MSVPEQQLSPDQKKAARRERARRERERERKRVRRRRVLVQIGVSGLGLALIAAVGFAVWDASRPADQSGPSNMASGGALFVGVDGKPSIVKTAGMARGADATPTDYSKYKAPAKIVTYLDLGCEYCKAFEDTNATQIEKLVASGQATLEVQPVAITGPYAVRAGSAMACLASGQPRSFFPALKEMYRQQPGEGATLPNSDILKIWEDAGVDPSSAVTDCVNSERYADWMQTRTETITADPKVQNPQTGSFGTPTVFVNDKRYQGTLTNPAEFAAFVRSTGSDRSTSTPGATPAG